MDGDETRTLNQVGALDRLWTKTQVRHSHRSGFLRIVNEIALRVIGRFFADDLDRILVGTNSTVGAESPKQRAYLTPRLGVEMRIKRQACKCHIVQNTYAEMIL